MKASEIVLDEWQQQVLSQEGNVLLCTGRQVGKTTIFAIKAALRMLNQRDCHIVMASLTEDQAKLIIVMILDYLQKNYKNMILGGVKKPTQNKIQLKNGSTVLARPVGTTGDAFRGFTGDVLYIDEASRMSELVWAASKPTLLTTAGDIWMSSTPAGKKGYFWEAFNKADRFKVFHISSEEVIKSRPINESWTLEKREKGIEFLENERADMSELEYGQEYLGLFLEDLRQYFSDELIERVCTLKRSFKDTSYCYLGVDVARLGGDKCAYEIIQRKGDIARQIENITKKEQLTTQTERIILELEKQYDFEKIGIDAGSGSLGVGIFDRLMENNNTKRKVEAMNNREISLDREGKKKQRIFKEDMYDSMLAMLENGDLLLLDDDDVKLSLRCVQWELKTVGNITKVKIFGRDAHIVEGLVRAAYLAKKRKINNLWISCY